MQNVRLLLILSILPLVPCAGQSAQTGWWPLDSGARVRVQGAQAGSSAQTGIVLKTTPDAMVFLPSGAPASYSVGLTDIKRLDVSLGMHSSKARGSLIGFATGAALAAGVAAALWKKPTDCGLCIDFGRGGDAAFAGVFGGVAGGLVGLAIGAVKRESWAPVPLNSR